VLGGGYIAAEMSHIFGSLGTKITIVERGECLLARHDADIRARFTELYRERFDLRLGATAKRVSATRKGVHLDLVATSGAQAAECEVLLVAVGRVPNSDRLGVGAAGIETDEHGHVVTDDTYQTNVPGIWALGDLANHFQLKHMANAEPGWSTTTCSTPAGRGGQHFRRCHRRYSPTRRSPRPVPPSRNCKTLGGPMSWPPIPTVTRPTAGRWRTPPAL